jgi:predicted membrane-bound spermidine synthase
LSQVIHLLFFLSGFSALIYQLVWVRVFGNVFGNTVHSASLVVAVFMMGLGAGSLVFGAWADRRYAVLPHSLLRAYAYVELAIALLALGVSALLPHLADLAVATSSYARDASGWYVLAWTSSAARAAIAIVLLTPITVLMGGTLTLLIRHLVRHDVERSGEKIAVLYAVNTGGAALGALLTDFALVPSYGLRTTQWLAVFFNVAAGAGAWYLASRSPVRLKPDPTSASAPARLQSDAARTAGGRPSKRERRVRLQPDHSDRTRLRPDQGRAPIAWVGLALFLSGLAAMGMEILWFRHFSILLGGFRAVFALLLTVILTGIAIGSLAGGALERRTRRSAECLIVVQGLFVAAALAGLGSADASALDARIAAERVAAPPGPPDAMSELLFNLLPMLFEVGPAALLMGFSFPLANAIVQRTASAVGRRAGALYLANTAGAVCGSLAAGFLLLPALGIQESAAVLMILAGLSSVALFMAVRGDVVPRRAFAGALLTAAAALAFWVALPADHVIARALPQPVSGERVIAVDEGLMEVISITERPREGRALLTNGHSMSSTAPRAQRYMRALAHIPLLSIDRPRSVLVIGFGVGNTTHAATLHPSIARVDVADLSPGVLRQADYFADANHGALKDPRVAVHVNDGRHHLQMQPPASYDLVTLEPPPPGYAGMAALYSREFYAIARARLTPGGFVSQWLPAYQIPTDSVLAMVRAFVDIFPQAVLVSGAESELLLLGTNGPAIEIDPERVTSALAAAPGVKEDLARLDLGGIREIAGSFIASGRTLEAATRGVAPVTDDRPIQEYGARSLLNLGNAVPASLVDLTDIAAWCPKCFAEGGPAPTARGLDTYLQLMTLAYGASPAEVAAARQMSERGGRVIAGSAYLGSIVPESADLHNILGIASASAGDIDTAVAEFRHALRLAPDSAATHWHLGAALAARGEDQEAIAHLRRSVEIDPRNEYAQNDLRILLAAQGSGAPRH